MLGMLKSRLVLRTVLLGLIFVVIFPFLSACNGGNTPTAPVTTPSDAPALSPTPSEPTPTPAPAAAVVNGERIPLAWFESELARYYLAQENLEQPVTDEAAAIQIVLNDIIDQVLLAQGAMESGYTLSNDEVQARIQALSQEVDLPAWMAQWGYTDADLFTSLKVQMLATYQREQIASSIPETADQVLLQQVFAFTQEGANNALLSLNSGTDFDDVAYLYDPVTGGHLGWVPRGYLLIPAVEEAAFNLPVGMFSDIIESEIGYHIVLVMDRQERPLSQDARLILQRQALHTWLESRRAASQIEILVN